MKNRVDKAGFDSKALKDNKKNENKAWLSQRVSEIGRDQLLYASNNTGRHVYTKEVLLFAEQEGLIQSEMAGICGVSQSQISQWISGQSKATNEQLGPLISQISPVMPGKDFHIEKVIKSAFLCLPDNWEEQAVGYYLRKRVGERLDVSPASVQEYAYGGLVIEEKKELDLLREGNTTSNELLTEQKHELEGLKASCEKESQAFEESLIEWNEIRATFLTENPEIAELSENKRNKILDRQFPRPAENKEFGISLIELVSEGLADDFNAEQIDVGFKLLLSRISEDAKLLEGKFLSDEHLVRVKYSKEKEVRKVYGRYEFNVLESLKYRDVSPLSLRLELSQIASELYGGRDLILACRWSDHWEKFDHEIKLDMEEAFVEFSLNHFDGIDDYKEYLEVEFENLQICGEKIFCKSTSGDHEIFSGLRCYRLFSNKLVVIHGYEYDDSDEYFRQLYIYENANDALGGILDMQKYSSLTDEEISELKFNLAKSGYKTPDYRSIY